MPKPINNINIGKTNKIVENWFIPLKAYLTKLLKLQELLPYFLGIKSYSMHFLE